MKVLHVAAECAPIVKVGGLADVVGSLPIALSKLGIEAAVALPFYRVAKAERIADSGQRIEITFRDEKEIVEVWETGLGDSVVKVYLFKNEKYLSAGPYDSKDAMGGSKEEVERFSFFNLAVFEWLKSCPVDVVHCHDYHASLLPKLVREVGEVGDAKTVLTIHNLANKGTEEIGLKMGIEKADFVTTVSPRYAQEILTPEFGEGLDGELRAKGKGDKVKGILNGIDTEYWDPVADPLVDRGYQGDKGDQEKFKQANKEVLIKKLGLDYTFGDKVPVFAFVGRLTKQKGLDILIPSWREFAKNHHAHLVVLASGSEEYASEILDEEVVIDELAGRPEVCFLDRFDEKLAHQIYAGADFLLMPSKFEPCGLSQMIAMRYGTVPIVRDVGGLHDSVKNDQTGIVFEDYSSEVLLGVLDKSYKIYNDYKNYNLIRQKAMAEDFSWGRSAKEYVEVYKGLIG